MEILLAIGLITFSIITLIFLAIFLILHLAFHRRFDPNPHLKYFTIDDFPGVDFDEVSLKSRRGVNLKGGFYYDDRVQNQKKLIIFSHGIGAGHQAYTHLMMAYVSKGYLVFAYDNTGCAHSDGQSIRGIPQASEDLHDVLDYLATTTYQQYRWILMGHSWGAYTVLTLQRHMDKIDKIISLTPFNDVTEMLTVYIPWLRFFRPFVALATALKFGLRASFPVTSHLKKLPIKTLIIAGEKDDEIPLKGNYDQFLLAKKINPNISIFLALNHRHNPYLSFRAEAYVIDTILAGSQRLLKEKDVNVLTNFYQNIDYRFVGEHDEQIIKRIDQFLEL